MVLVESFMEILERPTIGAVFVDIMMFLVPVWIAFLFGVTVGWIWKPKWASWKNCKFDLSAPSSPTVLVPSSSSKGLELTESRSFHSSKARTPSFASYVDAGSEIEQFDSGPSQLNALPITDEDLEHLWHLVERKDGGPPWKHMMDRSTPNMSYQAWQRDPETSPPQYCSRTVYEDATPELLRDFFWDDEFRLKWDDMIVYAETIDECPTTGTMIVHWVRKFPFFCSDREYIFGRRIWESGRSYYCVTKWLPLSMTDDVLFAATVRFSSCEIIPNVSLTLNVVLEKQLQGPVFLFGVPCPTIPRKDKPRRVDLYYSSWFIQAVESRKGNGQLTACEVLLFHHEDMGIPWEIAKFGVRQGMWGAVRKIERGLRSYQKSRASNMKISHCAFMAHVNTKIDPENLPLEGDEESSGTEVQVSPAKPEGSINIPKLLIIGGALVVACTLDRGIIPKALLFNVAKRFGNIGKRASPRA
ncbi:hypothetical protein RND71_030340 [Anisodus tanguticus]|uniref:START domain-containing protein n=1 Tax=Anisodus tanguticus TaxID=243964 RepID=A0AAE1RHK4_9SOLA|nr:hypothetical protein RND71_030340 [Anisodus tanguticus]